MQPGTPACHAAAGIDNDGVRAVAIGGHHPQKFTLGCSITAPDAGPKWLTFRRYHQWHLSHRLHSRMTRPHTF